MSSGMFTDTEVQTLAQIDTLYVKGSYPRFLVGDKAIEKKSCHVYVCYCITKPYSLASTLSSQTLSRNHETMLH